MVRARCIATRANGEPCQAFALPDEALCFSHHPDKATEVKAAQRRGGEAKANARRAARIWAESGKQIRPHELPDLLRGCILRVASGEMEPAQASAIANLARVSVQLTADLEMEARISALEAAAGVNQGSGIRRVK